MRWVIGVVEDSSPRLVYGHHLEDKTRKEMLVISQGGFNRCKTTTLPTPVTV